MQQTGKMKVNKQKALKVMLVIWTLCPRIPNTWILSFCVFFFFLASYADVPKHPDVLPDITQTTLCHILLSDLIPWRHSLNRVENSVKVKPKAGTLTYSLSSRKDL